MINAKTPGTQRRKEAKDAKMRSEEQTRREILARLAGNARFMNLVRAGRGEPDQLKSRTTPPGPWPARVKASGARTGGGRRGAHETRRPRRLTANELSLKHWKLDEAQRCGVQPGAIAMRLARGKYPGLQVRTVNARVKFVQV